STDTRTAIAATSAFAFSNDRSSSFLCSGLPLAGKKRRAYARCSAASRYFFVPSSARPKFEAMSYDCLRAHASRAYFSASAGASRLSASMAFFVSASAAAPGSAGALVGGSAARARDGASAQQSTAAASAARGSDGQEERSIMDLNRPL